MTPETRAMALKALGRLHDDLLLDLMQERTTRYAKWEGAFRPNPERIRLAREIRALRRAIAELKPATWPAWYATEPLVAYQREGR